MTEKDLRARRGGTLTRRGTITFPKTRPSTASRAVPSISSDARKATANTPSEDVTDSIGFSDIDVDLPELNEILKHIDY